MGFKITPQSKIGQIQSGYRGAVRQQVRGEVNEQFDFQFTEFSRLAWKIATGTEIRRPRVMRFGRLTEAVRRRPRLLLNGRLRGAASRSTAAALR